MPSAESQLEFQEAAAIKLSDHERTTGSITEDHLAEAIAAIHRDGLVVLENAVDIDHIDTLNSLLSNEAEAMAKLPTTHFNDVCTV